MRSRARGLAGAVTLAALLLSGGVAQAQGPVLEDGKTKAVYDYTKAIRERVFIPQPGIDQDGLNGDDFVTVDILRPVEGSATNKMPAIIDPSPYYTTVCRGAEGQCMADWDDDGAMTAGRCSTTTTSSRAATRTSSARATARATPSTGARCTAAPATSPATSRSSTGSTAA